MRKLIWCCSAASVLAVGGFLALTYYACRCPSSLVGRSMQAIANTSLIMQPLSGLTSLALRTSQANSPAQETIAADEECIPDDPQPIAIETVQELDQDLDQDLAQATRGNDIEFRAADPIVIHEDVPMPQEIPPRPSPPVDMTGMQTPAMLANGCAIVMPYCQDDGEEPTTPPIMPGAEDENGEPIVVDEKKADDLSEDSEDTTFKEWMNLFEAGTEDTPPSAEELPAPTEEEEDLEEPKCQEDSHRHEHYPGCPPVTCPYTGKLHCDQLKLKGGEESNEEPPHGRNYDILGGPRPHGKKRHSGKSSEDKDECPRTQGVDTMEFRPSDGGLDEYGPDPVH